MKNGFTLVELLAVIVILAVLALIATPVVLSIIDDAKESSMLRSAEMYLSGVENAVMRENMNSGGNFRPNDCTIINGNMTCGSTNVEVEVDGEVPSSGSIVFENGKIKEVTLNYTSGTIIKDDNGNLVYEGSEGTTEYRAYSIGDIVTIGTETFYVITDSDESQENVVLLTKYNIDTINLVQSSSADAITFAETNFWMELDDITYPYNLIESEPDVSHYAVKAAYDYGIKVEGIGRLMTLEEAQILKNLNSDILYGRNQNSSSGYLNYWLATIYDNWYVWFVYGKNSTLVNTYSNDFYADSFKDINFCGVRPIVEISKDKI